MMKTHLLWSLLCLVVACGPEGELATDLPPGSWQEPLESTARGGPGAIVVDRRCNAQALPPGDDESSEAVALPFTLRFYGHRYTQAYVNTNGSLTFERPEGYSMNFRLETVTQPVIAPFFADVDTHGSSSGRVRYGTTTFEGRPAFCVNWLDVGYYRRHADKLNRFQLLLVDRGDTGAGNFDIVMNYGRLVWDSGDANNGYGGLGGASTAAGFSAGSSDPHSLYLLAGSYVPGALLDSEQATGLIWRRNWSTTPGRHMFAIRNGVLPRPRR
jgi:hypothetical protein